MTSEELTETNLTDTADFFEELFSKAAQQSFKALSTKDKLDNVAIFIDYDNVYWTLMNSYSHDPNHDEPEKNLFIQLWKRYGQDKVRTFRAYAAKQVAASED